MARVVARNNVLAGGFLLASLALAVFMSFLLSDRDGLGKTTSYVVRFPIAQGAVGLKPDSEVRVGGQVVGRVRSVRLVEDPPGSGISRSVDAVVAIRQNVALFPDARVALDVPLLGTLTSINISDVGSPDHPQGRLPEGSVLTAGLSVPGFLAQAGIGPDMVDKVRGVLDKADQTAAEVLALVRRNAPGIDDAVENVRATTADARERFSTWSKDADATVTNTRAFSERFTGWADRADATIDSARSFTTKLNEALDANRPTVDRILANTDQLVTDFRAGPYERINQALATAKGAMDEMARVVGNAGKVLDEETPNIRRMLANARLASDQLKLTLMEVRAQPWRLLYRPEKREFENELLYDSARAYAEAVSDLRAAAESLGAMTRRLEQAPSAEDLADARRLNDQLKAAFDRYARLEADLIKRLEQAE